MNIIDLAKNFQMLYLSITSIEVIRTQTLTGNVKDRRMFVGRPTHIWGYVNTLSFL